MANKTPELDKMRTNVGTGNRTRTFGVKKPARLGTAENPAVVNVQSEARFKEVAATLEEHGWKYRIALEPEKPEDVSDLQRLLNPVRPIRAEKKVGRNEPCPCGSGKKSKHCRDH